MTLLDGARRPGVKYAADMGADELGSGPGNVLDLFERPAWFADAVCKGMNLNLFFAERGQSLAAAKAVCQGCPVREDCLEWALTNGDQSGIFGGLSEKARGRLRAERNRGLAKQGITPKWWTKCENGHPVPNLTRGCQECGSTTMRAAQHGTAYSYRKGCRCEPCTGANREAGRRKQQARRDKQRAAE